MDRPIDINTLLVEAHREAAKIAETPEQAEMYNRIADMCDFYCIDQEPPTED